VDVEILEDPTLVLDLVLWVAAPFLPICQGHSRPFIVSSWLTKDFSLGMFEKGRCCLSNLVLLINLGEIAIPPMQINISRKM